MFKTTEKLIDRAVQERRDAIRNAVRVKVKRLNEMRRRHEMFGFEFVCRVKKENCHA